MNNIILDLLSCFERTLKNDQGGVAKRKRRRTLHRLVRRRFCHARRLIFNHLFIITSKHYNYNQVTNQLNKLN